MNWEVVVLAIIAGLPATLAAAGALVQAWKTHKAVNSRMTELLDITRAAAADRATLVEKKASAERQQARDQATLIEKNAAEHEKKA